MIGLIIVISPLPYETGALEPWMDEQTVMLHYTKHHQGYVDNLNKAFEKHPDFYKIPLLELLKKPDQMPTVIRTAVINNGGGHINHDFFWKCMAPGGTELDPKGEFAQALNKKFGSLEEFKKQFKEAAVGHFASGWAWLVMDKDGHLQIMTTPNHGVPQVQGLEPLLVLDVWEHAYYLKHQNRRPDFVENWWHIVNWKFVEQRYHELRERLSRAA